MFEKMYDDGSKVVLLDGETIALWIGDRKVASANSDWYYDERGPECKTREEAADLFHSQHAHLVTKGQANE